MVSPGERKISQPLWSLVCDFAIIRPFSFGCWWSHQGLTRMLSECFAARLYPEPWWLDFCWRVTVWLLGTPTSAAVLRSADCGNSDLLRRVKRWFWQCCGVCRDSPALPESTFFICHLSLCLCLCLSHSARESNGRALQDEHFISKALLPAAASQGAVSGLKALRGFLYEMPFLSSVILQFCCFEKPELNLELSHTLIGTFETLMSS